MFNLLLAGLAGIVTIAAPCTLPVLPILLGASISQTSRLRPVFIAAGFVISFATVALALSAITRAFNFDPNILRDGASILLVLFGLLMIWPTPFQWLSARIPMLAMGGDHPSSRQGNLGGFIIGMTLGLVWTPCAGPVLGSILTLIASSKDAVWASTLLIAYALGAAIPMLLIAYGGQAVTTRMKNFARVAPRLQQGFGVVVIAFAVANYLQYDTLVVAWLTQLYPNGQLGL